MTKKHWLSVDEPGQVVRVAKITAETLYLDYPDGRSGTASMPSEGFPWSEGDVLLLTSSDGTGLRAERLEPHLWPGERRIGTVRYVGDSDIVIEVDGKTSLAVASLPVQVGNTVEVDSKWGRIERIVAETPIRAFDIQDLVKLSPDFRIPTDLVSDDLNDFQGASAIRKRAEELLRTSLAAGGALEAIGVEPVKGALFWGPPGTGKTMLARILAKNFKSTFFHVKGPEIFASLVGQSEGIIRHLFAEARTRAPSVIFFDEIDSIGSRDDPHSHETTKKVVGQLLTEMDGFKGGSGVLVIAATNSIGGVDPALLRPGRFTWKLEFKLPDGQGRLRILQRQADSLQIGETLPLEEIALTTNGWSPADLKAIWTEAAILAVDDDRDRIHVEDFRGGYQRVKDWGRSRVRGIE